jgi:hypothetical protein
MKQCEYCRNASPFQFLRCESCGAPFSIRTMRYKERQASAPSPFLYDSRVVDAEDIEEFIAQPGTNIPINFPAKGAY